jgi:signal transduction histidine kinase
LLHANNPLQISRPLLTLVSLVTIAALSITILYAQYYDAGLRARMIAPAELRYYFDADALLTVADFLQRKDTIAPSDGTPQPPVSFSGQHWFYIVPPPATDSTQQRFLQIDLPWLDHVEITALHNDQPGAHYSVGDDDPFTGRPIAFRKPVIPLAGTNTQQEAFVARIPAQGGISFPAFFIDEPTLEKQIRSDHFFYGAIFSAILVLGIYNLFVFFSLRDASYIHYIFYIYAFGALQAAASAMGQQYLWPDAADATTIIAHLLMALTNFTIVGFVIHFLRLKENAPRFYHLLRFLALLSVLVTPGLFFTNYLYVKYFLHATSFTIMALIIACSFMLVLRRDRTALFMLASNIVLFPSITIGLLRFQARFDHAIWAEHAAELAIVIEAIILSLGLADRIASLRIGRNRAEQARLAEQRAFSQRMIRSQEHQKREIGKLLHDSFSHRLLNLKSQIATLDRGEPGATQAAAMREAVNELLGEVRDLSHLIYPAVLDHLGFEAAVHAVLRSAFDNTDIAWQCDIQPLELPQDVQLMLYRATQECVNNILKHAGASECFVYLHSAAHSKGFVFCVKDDGVGFDVTSELRFGLRMLREHVQVTGGELLLYSDSELGTRVEIRF